MLGPDTAPMLNTSWAQSHNRWWLSARPRCDHQTRALTCSDAWTCRCFASFSSHNFYHRPDLGSGLMAEIKGVDVNDKQCRNADSRAQQTGLLRSWLADIRQNRTWNNLVYEEWQSTDATWWQSMMHSTDSCTILSIYLYPEETWLGKQMIIL